MLELISNLREIQSARNNMKTALENKGMTVTNDIRTYAEVIANIPSGSGSGDVKLFETEQAMQNDSSPQEGDLATIYRSELQNYNGNSTFTKVKFPKTVTLPQAYTGEGSYQMFRPVDTSGGGFDMSCDLSSSSFGANWYGEGPDGMIDGNIEYTSADGITYVSDQSGDLTVDFGVELQREEDEEWDSNFGYFMKILGYYYGGLYKYVTNSYVPAQTQLTAVAEDVYGTNFMGKNGAETGTLNQMTNLSITQLNNRASFYNAILNWTTNETNLSNCFYQNINLTTIPLLDTSNVTNMSTMFSGCTNLTTIPLLNTSNVTNMGRTFSGCRNLTTIPQLDTSNVTNMSTMFSGCTNLTTIPQLDTSNVTNMSSMFNNCTSLTTIPQLDTNNVTNMSTMFNNCTSLTTIPQLDTNNVTNMGTMFNNCTSLTTIPQLDTNNVTDMGSMFSGCTSLTTIPQLNTSNVTNMSYMFNDCTNLTTIPQLDTNNVTNMGRMFSGCRNLTTIPQLNTSNVTNMYRMFHNCTSLQEIDLSGGTLNSNCSFSQMFEEVPTSCTIYVKDQVSKNLLTNADNTHTYTIKTI